MSWRALEIFVKETLLCLKVSEKDCRLLESIKFFGALAERRLNLHERLENHPINEVTASKRPIISSPELG